MGSVRRILLIVAIALVAEVFLFNAGYWGSWGNTPLVLSTDAVVIDGPDDSITFDDLDVAVSSLSISFGDGQADQTVYARYSITDDGTSAPYDLPSVEMLPSNASSCSQSLHAYGHLKSLTVSFPQSDSYNDDSGAHLEDNAYPIVVQSVTLNAVRPFVFDPFRFLLLMGVLLVLSFFRPSSWIYRIEALDTASGVCLVRRAVAGGTIILVCAGVLVHADWVQVATPFYNADAWDGSAPVTIIEPSWYWDVGNSEYDELAHALARGSVALDIDPPAWLSQVDDPYDPGTRDAMGAQTGAYAMVDAAYFDGRYYVYFGIVPEVLLYLPFYMVTGLDFPNAFAVIIGGILFAIGLHALLKSVVRAYFPRTSLGVFLLVYLGAFACSGILFGLGRPTLYQVPIAFARVFVVWALYLWLEGWRRSRASCIAGGSFCMALVAGCRPQFLLFAACAVPMLIAMAQGRVGSRRGAGPELPAQVGTEAPACPMSRTRFLAALVFPAIAVAAGLMWYNTARFGSPFDFGASRNLAGNNMQLRGFDPARLVDGLFLYLLQPPSLSTVFPFLMPADASTTYEGMTIIEPLAGGALAAQPFLWFLLLTGRLRRDRPCVCAAVAGCGIAGLFVCCFDIQASGILGRYYQDIGLYLACAASLAVLALLHGSSVGICADAGDGLLVSSEVSSPQPYFSLLIGLLYAAVACTFLYFLLVFFLTFDNAACNTMAGSDPATWEYLRQTFSWWL